MSRVGWWGAALVFVIIGTAYMRLLTWSSPRAPEESANSYWITMAVLAAPAGFAAAILWIAWWRRVGQQISTVDGLQLLLATAIATLPADRRDWGQAMAAELAQVPDRRERWRFAAGCVRTAVFPPRGHGVPAIAVAGLAAGVVAGTAYALGRTIPEMRLFAVTFVGLIGLLSTVAVLRAPRLRRPASGLVMPVVGFVAVAACIGVVGYFLATDASIAFDPSGAVTLAVVLAGILWLLLAPPRLLTTSRLARWVGLAAALAVAVGLVASAGLNTGDDPGILSYLAGAPVVALFVGSAVVAAVGRSLRAGLQATVWAVLLTCVLTFAVYVVAEVNVSRATGHALLDGDGVSGDNTALHAAIVWILGYQLLWAVPFGVLGAGLGALIARGSQRPGADPTPSPPASP